MRLLEVNRRWHVPSDRITKHIYLDRTVGQTLLQLMETAIHETIWIIIIVPYSIIYSPCSVHYGPKQSSQYRTPKGFTIQSTTHTRAVIFAEQGRCLLDGSVWV